MSQQKPIVVESPREFFAAQVDAACKRVKLNPLPLSRYYLADLLERYVSINNLFSPDENTGKLKQETLAELYLRAQNATTPVKIDLLKRLGDSSLYISGFFGDSLSRKIVDIDYYVDMGGVAYAELANTVSGEEIAQVYSEFSVRFAGFVDVLTYISQESMVQTNGDLLRLYDRYLATGSKLAEEQLAEQGLLNADLSKVRSQKV